MGQPLHTHASPGGQDPSTSPSQPPEGPTVPPSDTPRNDHLKKSLLTSFYNLERLSISCFSTIGGRGSKQVGGI